MRPTKPVPPRRAAPALSPPVTPAALAAFFRLRGADNAPIRSIGRPLIERCVGASIISSNPNASRAPATMDPRPQEIGSPASAPPSGSLPGRPNGKANCCRGCNLPPKPPASVFGRRTSGRANWSMTTACGACSDSRLRRLWAREISFMRATAPPPACRHPRVAGGSSAKCHADTASHDESARRTAVRADPHARLSRCTRRGDPTDGCDLGRHARGAACRRTGKEVGSRKRPARTFERDIQGGGHLALGIRHQVRLLFLARASAALLRHGRCPFAGMPFAVF